MNSPESPGPFRPAVLALAILVTAAGCATDSGRPDSLRRSLLFHASFDRGLDADVAAGPRELSNAPSMHQRDDARPGLPTGGEVQLAVGEGRFGNALRFTRRESPLVFFSAEKNMGYRAENWSGTVSFWLRVNPAVELAPGYCDPIQITPRAWNDAAFFVEFERRTNDIPFRLGAYADLAVWNPDNRKWEDLTPAEKPLVTVAEPPFGGGHWTHVVFTFEHFNTGRDDGIARLYLDGRPAGVIGPRLQTFTWEEGRSLMMLGLGYLGLWDELAVFNRSLSSEEVNTLYTLPNGIAGLR